MDARRSSWRCDCNWKVCWSVCWPQMFYKMAVSVSNNQAMNPPQTSLQREGVVPTTLTGKVRWQEGWLTSCYLVTSWRSLRPNVSEYQFILISESSNIQFNRIKNSVHVGHNSQCHISIMSMKICETIGNMTAEITIPSGHVMHAWYIFTYELSDI